MSRNPERISMRPALGLLIVSNAALFLFGAVQHAGIPLGRFHEPTIIPAVIVETRMRKQGRMEGVIGMMMGEDHISNASR